jgi:4-amino-4-deoxy-L-arabinose transferase-like glycosyltransferase
MRWLAGWPAVVALALLYWGMATSGACGKSPTFDEPIHLTGGVSYWLRNDYRISPEIGNLPQRWFALPLVLGGVTFPAEATEAWQRSNQWLLGHQLFYGGDNSPERLLGWGRGAAALFGVGLLLLIYGWARRLHGRGGGVLALGLAAFSPTLLAYGPLMTTDAALSLMLLASASCLWRVLHRVTLPWLLGSGVVLGLLLLTKASALVIAPVALVLALLRCASRRPLEVVLPGWSTPRVLRRSWRRAALFAGLLLIHVLLGWGVVWAGYGLRYAASPGHVEAPFSKPWEGLLLRQRPAVSALVNALRARRLLPEAFLYQVPYVLEHSQDRAFLRGELRSSGWWSFFPLALLLKTPLALLALALLGAAAVVIGWRRGDAPATNGARGPPAATNGARGPPAAADALYATAPLVVTLIVYWIFALASPLNIGLRHILPTWPALLILAGGAARLCHRRPWAVAVAAAAALLVVTSLWIRPHYLTFFNAAAGGPAAGYRLLVDSSLDWGQDLDGLRRWLERRGLNHKKTSPRVYLSYFGSADPAHHGIEVRRLPSFMNWPPPGGRSARRLHGGVYCVSATQLQNVHLVLRRPDGTSLPPPVPWRREHERTYRALRARFAEVFALEDRGDRAGALRRLAALGSPRYELYDRLRFARLCAALRAREPDDTVGYSILIYRLTDDEVRRALE